MALDLEPLVVTALIQEQTEVRDYLLENAQISFASALESTAPKVALLSAASWIEDRVQEIVLDLYRESIPDGAHQVSFVHKAGVERRYHSWFQWNSRNANSFFGLFGPDFKAFCADRISESPDLDRQIRAFMELGSLRNGMVHGNFAAYRLEKSLTEVEDLFADAVEFVRALPALLRMAETVE